MSNYCGGAFKESRKSSWRDSNSRNKPTPWYERKEPMCCIIPIKNMSTSKSAASISQIGGHQPKDMRSKVQQRLDNDPFFGRNSNRYNSTVPNGQTVVIIKSPTLKDALFTMTGCIDLVISGAEAGVHAMQSIELPTVVRRAGKVTGLLGLLDNGLQLYKDPNWTDGAQIAAQLVLIGFGSTLGAPVVLGGGIVLFVWELAE